MPNIPAACIDERVATEFMETKRWGDSPFCPHCLHTNVYQMRNRVTKERQCNYRWRCRLCKKQYTVRTGTVFEDSRIPLHHWCYAFFRASTSKKGVSALEMQRHTGMSYKSALFMLRRIRYAMADSAPPLLTGSVEVDEVYIGGRRRFRKTGKRYRGRGTQKTLVLAMVERDGCVKTKVNAKNFKEVIRNNVDKSSSIITDEYRAYRGIGKEYAGGHHTVCHSAYEYARGNVHSNTVEGFFSIVKRSIHGIYHSVSKKHLHSYMAEFEFRYNFRKLSDADRMDMAIKSSIGKRLRYKATDEQNT